MTSQELIAQLLGLPDAEAQRRLLQSNATLLDEEVAEALKAQADRFLRSDLHRSLQAAELLSCLTELTGNPLFHALGLLARGNACSIGGMGEHQRAVELYDQAAEIYESNGLPVEQARCQVGKVFALAMLGCYDDALKAGQWASEVLEQHSQWRALAGLTMNLAITHGRQRDDARALTQLDRASQFYRRLGTEGEGALAWVEHNRSMVLRNLGRFDASIRASQAACQMLTEQGQTASAAQTQEGLAFTYLMLGRYNEALKILDRVRDLFLADGRRFDAVLAELFTSYCLLRLRCFSDVLDKSHHLRDQFSEMGRCREIAEAVLHEAIAYAGLDRHAEALQSLAEARSLFAQEDNQVWVTIVDLESATVLYHQGRFEESLAAAQECVRTFQTHDLQVQESESCLLAARASLALRQEDVAVRHLTHALGIAQEKRIPSQLYQCHYLLGMVDERRGKLQDALASYDRAIHELEQLCGRMMVEFRPGYLEDKTVVYEDVVALCLDLGRPSLGLGYAERAKSRVLLDLLAYRLDLSIRARNVADEDLVAELVDLRRERDRLYRRWRTSEGIQSRGWRLPGEGAAQPQPDVLHLEQQIAALWRRLLIRNADYAHDASLWQVWTEPVQPYLDPGTLLVEYFYSRGQLIAFLLTAQELQVRRLYVDNVQVQRLIQFLWLNLRATARCGLGLVPSLKANARGILQQLHELLVAPMADALAVHPRLIVVPHGLLHYLPFHALHDGHTYLLERHEVSYLPAASLLRFCQRARPATSKVVVFGHSYEGVLPYAVHEARRVAKILGGHVVLENEATSARLRGEAAACRILHLAAHGDFRPDNPLFSGLALADGWVTTLDIFGLSLDASLVTLSACQTGCSVVGGGDELLGLVRAFLYAGAASLVLSQWAVEDRSTAQLMTAFYSRLAEGWSKGAALRWAQRQLIADGDGAAGASSSRYAHPYYWAPFFLVGDTGPL